MRDDEFNTLKNAAFKIAWRWMWTALAVGLIVGFVAGGGVAMSVFTDICKR